MSDSRALVPWQPPPPPALVDRNGRPLRGRDDLTREIAGPSIAGVRSIMTAHPAQGLTPQRLAQLLRGAENGDARSYLELAEEMEEKHLHYQAEMGVRKRAVAQLPITVEAAGDASDEEADAQLVRDWVARDTLQAEIFDMLDAVGKGYSATELVWALDATPWLPDRLIWQDPRFFEFDRVDGRTLYLKGDAGLPEALPQAKFIVHTHSAKSGLPIRGGLARSVAWAYLFTNFGIKDWIVFLEIYGLPLRIGQYDNGTSEKDIATLRDAIAQLGSDAGAVIPKSMLIEFVNSSGGGAGSTEMFRTLCDYFDMQISKAVLGQTNATNAQAGGLGSGQANVHNEVRGDIRDSDAAQLAATLNRQLVRPIVEFNRGKRKRYPRIVIGRPEAEDIDAYLKTVEAAAKHGIPVGVGAFRKATGLAEPEPGEETLGQAGKAPQDAREGEAGPDSGSEPGDPLKSPLRPLKRASAEDPEEPVAAAADKPPKRDRIDRLADEHLGDWERLLTPAAAAIERLLAASADEAAFVAGLARLADTIDLAALTEALGAAAFTARLAGEAAIADEQRG